MAKKIVTLYIDDSSLRLMVTHGKRIKKWGDSPLEPGLVKGNVIINEAEVAAKVKQLFKAQKVRAKKVIVGLSGLHSLSRPIILPQLPNAMLAEAVTREARRVLPVPLEQLYISWQPIPAPVGKTQVFLVAIPRKTADALLKVLYKAGLKPYFIDIKPLALSRVVREATAVVVDVQPTEFDIVIIADGIPQPVRTVPFPAKVLSRQEKLPIIRDELSRTVEFFNSNNPEKPLVPDVPVYISGELADEPELCKLLSDELGYNVLPLSSLLKRPEQLDLNDYMVNVGLALKELAKEAGPSVATLNSLPVSYQPKPISLVRIAVVPGVIVVVGLLVMFAMLVQNTSASVDSMYNRLENTNHVFKQKQLQKKELMADIAELEKNLAAVKASRDTYNMALGSLEKQGNTVNGDLEATTDNLLSTMVLTGISHGSGKLTIDGRSPSEVEVLSYARSLDDSGRFSEVTIANLRKVDDGEMDFRLVLKTRGAG